MEGAWNSITGWLSGQLDDFAITKIYIACAVAGGSVILAQTGLSLFGLGAHEMDPDMSVDDLEGGDGLQFLSVRTLASFLTFFGLVGWAGAASGWSTPAHVSAATLSGVSVMVLVALILRAFQRMHSSGTQQTEGAIGQAATVYLRIPGELKGKGKITVSLQGRTVELEAITPGPELATGADCRVVRIVTSGTVEVVPID